MTRCRIPCTPHAKLHLNLSHFDLEMCFAPQWRTRIGISTAKSGPTWRCASRHNGAHIFDISTSKNAPTPSVFNTFDLDKCFTSQRHALFPAGLNTFDVEMCSAPAALASLLFDPTNDWKNNEMRISYLFAHLYLLSSHSFSSLSSLRLFSSLALPTSAFPSLHILSEV